MRILYQLVHTSKYQLHKVTCTIINDEQANIASKINTYRFNTQSTKLD